MPAGRLFGSAFAAGALVMHPKIAVIGLAGANPPALTPLDGNKEQVGGKLGKFVDSLHEVVRPIQVQPDGMRVVYDDFSTGLGVWKVAIRSGHTSEELLDDSLALIATNVPFRVAHDLDVALEMTFHGGDDILLEWFEKEEVGHGPDADVLADDRIALALLDSGGVDGYTAN